VKTAYRVRAPDEVAKLLLGLHPQIKRKVRAGLDVLCKDARAGKALQAELAGLRSFRVGQFRIVYRIAPRGILDIVTIGPRKTIYEESIRLVAKARAK
jgi:mRNA-degrading endonuclease RelE of RelBE toxin-antitoxin system